MGLNNNPKNHTYEYLSNINIVANHFSENYKAGEKPKQTFVSLDDVVVEDKHYLECKKSAEGVQVPQVKCNIALARISGKSVTGETSLLVDGDAHCSQYDKIDLYASLDTSEYIGKTQIPHIITIVYPNGKNILVPCLKTNFIAEEVGVYTIIMSFNKEAGSCGTFSKYLYVIERPKPVLQNLVQIEAYKDINCNEIKDIKEAYVYNYTLKIKNLQTNAITTFDRNTRIILADLAEDQYELEFLVANKSGMRKRVVKVVKINNTTKLLEIKINNCEIVKEVETKLNVLYNKQLHNSPIFSK